MSAASTSRGERVTVLDATHAEEQLRSGSFIGKHMPPTTPYIDPRFFLVSVQLMGVVALNKSGEVCWLNKSGGLSMEAAQVLDCIQIAYDKVKEWIDYIEGEVSQDEEKRDKQNRYVESTAENERYQVPLQQI